MTKTEWLLGYSETQQAHWQPMNEGFQRFIRFPMKAHCHGANGRGRDGRTHPSPPAAGGASVHTVTQAARLSPGSLNQTVSLYLELNLKTPNCFTDGLLHCTQAQGYLEVPIEQFQFNLMSQSEIIRSSERTKNNIFNIYLGVIGI